MMEYSPRVCPVCRGPAAQSCQVEDVTTVNCPQCGLFRVTFEATISLDRGALGDKYSRTRANACGWLNSNRNVLVDLPMVDALATLPDPGILPRTARILETLAEQSTYVGQALDINLRQYMGISSSISLHELSTLLGYLDSRGWMKIEFRKAAEAGVETLPAELTPEGWIHLDEQRRVSAGSSQGFVAMCFDDSLGEAYARGFDPAIRRAGYDPLRMDRLEHLGRIDDRIMVEIRRSRFLVADLTGHRGGVYYEAGFAMGLGLPVVWSCRDDESEDLHFDIRQYNCIFWDTPETLHDKLTHRILSVLGRGPSVGAV